MQKWFVLRATADSFFFLSYLKNLLHKKKTKCNYRINVFFSKLTHKIIYVFLIYSGSVFGISHYKVLGVTPSSSQADIQKAYRKMAMKYHPDRNPSPSAVDEMQKINRAYEVLTNLHKNFADSGEQESSKDNDEFNSEEGEIKYGYQFSYGPDFFIHLQDAPEKSEEMQAWNALKVLANHSYTPYKHLIKWSNIEAVYQMLSLWYQDNIINQTVFNDVQRSYDILYKHYTGKKSPGPQDEKKQNYDQLGSRNHQSGLWFFIAMMLFFKPAESHAVEKIRLEVMEKLAVVEHIQNKRTVRTSCSFTFMEKTFTL